MGHYPICSGGNHTSNVVLHQMIEPALKEWGVQFAISGYDHHLKHMSTPFYQSFVLGSAAEVRPAEILRPEGAVLQRAAFSQLGYGLLQAKPYLGRDSVL